MPHKFLKRPYGPTPDLLPTYSGPTPDLLRICSLAKWLRQGYAFGAACHGVTKL